MKINLDRDTGIELVSLLDGSDHPGIAKLRSTVERIIDAPVLGMKLTQDELQALTDWLMNGSAHNGTATRALVFDHALPKLQRMLDHANREAQKAAAAAQVQAGFAGRK